MNTTGKLIDILPMRNNAWLPKFTIIGAPGDKRIILFQKALSRYGLENAEVISYAQITKGFKFEPSRSRIIRIESPGRTWEMYRLFLENGQKAAQAEDSPFVVADRCNIPDPMRQICVYPNIFFKAS